MCAGDGGTSQLSSPVFARQDARVAQHSERVAIRPYREDDRPMIEALFDQFQEDLVELDDLRRLRRPQG
jgi:hypothetical protein